VVVWFKLVPDRMHWVGYGDRNFTDRPAHQAQDGQLGGATRQCRRASIWRCWPWSWLSRPRIRDRVPLARGSRRQRWGTRVPAGSSHPTRL